MGALVICILAGTVLTSVAVWVGWATAAIDSHPLVRFVGWWLDRIVLPQVTAGRWIRRAAAIAVNNLLILAGLMVLGRWLIAVLFAIAGCGVAMGIALRLLPGLPGGTRLANAGESAYGTWRMRVGVGLNLLEPPAIVVALGLAIGRSAIPLSDLGAWGGFVTWVIPAMLVAAGGEALWLGVLLEGGGGPASVEPEHDEPDQDDGG
jgi:hypothetical protein